MAAMDQTQKKIAFLHRYPKDQIRETNSSYTYLTGIDTLTFRKFNRLNPKSKLIKSILWIFYAPCLVIGRGYDVIYCDDSFPFYPALVKMVCPRSKVIIRLGDFHLMYYLKGWPYSLAHFFEKLTWKIVDDILAISEVMADKIESDIGRRPKVVLDPIDPSVFNIVGKKTKDQIVMFHGLITKNKNIILAIEAAFRMPDVWFWILGDGPDLERLKDLAPQNVVFTGWHLHSQISSLMSECSVGLSLRSDNPGNQYVVTSAFLQYAAMGKPCLTTKRQVFGDYKWQFDNVDEMVDKLKYLLKHPEEGRTLKKAILRKHNAKKIAKQIWKIIASA